MSIKSFQTILKSGYGMVISTATHRTESLLAVSHDLIITHNMRKLYPLAKEIKEILNYDGDMTLSHADYYDKLYIKPEDNENASDLLNETVYNRFNEIAPRGYYFGTPEGDGSSFGFWKEAPEGKDF